MKTQQKNKINFKNAVKAFAVIGILVIVNASFAEFEQELEQAQVLTPVQQKMKTVISVDFNETEIDDVIKIMAAQADVDIVKSPLVSGTVTATLTDVPLEEALSNILSAHGYGYVSSENMIKILPLEEIYNVREQMVNKVYRINYADVREVERALRKFVSKDGYISSNPGTSNIIVTDTESKMTAIDSFVKEIDRVTPQVLVEVRIWDVTSTDNLDIGVEWSIGRNTPLYTFDPQTGDKTDPTSWRNENENGSFLPYREDAEMFPYRRSNPFVGGEFDKDTGGTLRVAVLDGAVDLEFALSVLRKQVGAKLLANPRILVLDNEMANFNIVREIPYKEQTDTSAGGQLTSTEFKDVGVNLQVTPHVTADDLLRLHILPEFGVAEPQERNPVTGELEVPTVNTRKLETTTLLANGQTVVLGGLRKLEASKDISKVPLLGDMPIFGELFRYESESEVVNELLVFITPRVVINPMLSAKEKDRYSRSNVRDPYCYQPEFEEEPESCTYKEPPKEDSCVKKPACAPQPACPAKAVHRRRP